MEVEIIKNNGKTEDHYRLRKWDDYKKLVKQAITIEFKMIWNKNKLIEYQDPIYNQRMKFLNKRVYIHDHDRDWYEDTLGYIYYSKEFKMIKWNPIRHKSKIYLSEGKYKVKNQGTFINRRYLMTRLSLEQKKLPQELIEIIWQYM